MQVGDTSLTVGSSPTVHHSAFATHRLASAFSLVELLVSMTVLLLIVTVTAMLYNQTEDTWAVGTDHAEADRIGQNALSMIRRDLQCAVADELLTFVITNSEEMAQVTNSEAYFVSLQHGSANGDRAAREVQYWVEPAHEASGSSGFALLRASCGIADLPDSANAYRNTHWYEDGALPLGVATVAENVSAFVLREADALGVVSTNYDSQAPANSNRLPQYVDVLIEVLSERSTKQAADMTAHGAPGWETFVEQKARRYTTRVYFHNLNGYRKR